MGPMNDSEFGSWGKWVSTHPFLRRETSHGKAIHPKLPIEVQLKWRMIVTSIGHQSKSRSKMWILNHLTWLASISNRGYESEFGFTRFDRHRPYDPLTKDESFGLRHGGQCRGIFLGGNTLDVTSTQEHDGLSLFFFGVVQERAFNRILDIFEMKAQILLTINLDCSMHSPPDGASSCRSTRE